MLQGGAARRGCGAARGAAHPAPRRSLPRWPPLQLSPMARPRHRVRLPRGCASCALSRCGCAERRGRPQARGAVTTRPRSADAVTPCPPVLWSVGRRGCGPARLSPNCFRPQPCGVAFFLLVCWVFFPTSTKAFLNAVGAPRGPVGAF